MVLAVVYVRPGEVLAWQIFTRTTLSIWEFTDCEAATMKAIEIYGCDAMTAAAHCGLSAHFNGRERDFRFWVKVFRLLQGADNAPKSGRSIN